MATPPKKPASKTPPEPERPKNLPHGRWLGDFPDLSAAEERLVECCRNGEVWGPNGWDWKNPVRPTETSDANCIRAGLIRFLALGGDALHPVQEEGVMVRGAWISSTLSLHQCHASVRLDLKHCHFSAAPDFMKAQLPELVLSGSMVPGLNADGMKVTGGVFLRDGFIATDEVRLLGAEIGGTLDSGGSKLSNAGGNALNADGLKSNGDFFLCEGFTAIGAVRLLGAEIAGDLVCSGGSFDNAEGYALGADRINVAGGVFLRNATIKGAIALAAARIGTLNDDSNCWRSGGHALDGLHYDRIIGPIDASSRIAWLKSQRPDQIDRRDWKPQPWEQLIKVLREMGHPGTAAEIAMEKQRMMRLAGHIGPRRPDRTLVEGKWFWIDRGLTWLANFPARTLHHLYGMLAGYGYRPTRIVLWMFALWLGCTLAFTAGRDAGYLGPSNPVINASPSFAGCGAPGETKADGTSKAYWHTPSCPMPAEYTTLSPALYSLDLILPLVILQQDADWAPIVINENGKSLVWGQWLRALMWFEILFGWLASLMFVAIVSRLVDKD